MNENYPSNVLKSAQRSNFYYWTLMVCLPMENYTMEMAKSLKHLIPRWSGH